MTGTGEVTKRRVREGRGDFPVDCPLEDCAVRVHFRVRRPGSQQVAPKRPQLLSSGWVGGCCRLLLFTLLGSVMPCVVLFQGPCVTRST